MVGPEEKLSINVSRWLENAILRLVFANTVFHKRATLVAEGIYGLFDKNFPDV